MTLVVNWLSEILTKTRPCLASFLFVALLLTGCREASQPVLEISGLTMGTAYHIKVVPGKLPADEALHSRIQQRLDQLDQMLTTYDDRSELSQLNHTAINEVKSIPPELWAILSLAQTIYQLTDNAFDPTVAPLVDLWGFGPLPGGDQIPTDKAIQQAMQLVDFKSVELMEFNRVVRHKPIRLDLSAIAKGYAVDDIARLLFAFGYQSFMVEIGGELYVSGKNAKGKPWQIAIESPRFAGGSPVEVMALSGMAVATSGDYRNYYEKGGQRYSHTIDPRTGRPITHRLASVTVLDSSVAQADALATAFMVLGVEKSLELAERNRIAVFFIAKQGDQFVTQASSSFYSSTSGER